MANAVAPMKYVSLMLIYISQFALFEDGNFKYPSSYLEFPSYKCPLFTHADHNVHDLRTEVLNTLLDGKNARSCEIPSIVGYV